MTRAALSGRDPRPASNDVDITHALKHDSRSGRPLRAAAVFFRKGQDMADSRMPITRPGLLRLKDELKRLKAIERPKIVREIAEARSHGDLSENAEYHAAKEKQSHLEGRILQVEDWIARAEVIEVGKLRGDRVVFGATVTVADADSGDEVRYQVVGELEADLKQGKISVTSPIARAMIGKQEGDVVKVRTPGGEREYEISAVEFIEEELPAGEA
jgi:transcription elongation factor GreA